MTVFTLIASSTSFRNGRTALIPVMDLLTGEQAMRSAIGGRLADLDKGALKADYMGPVRLDPALTSRLSPPRPPPAPLPRRQSFKRPWPSITSPCQPRHAAPTRPPRDNHDSKQHSSARRFHFSLRSTRVGVVLGSRARFCVFYGSVATSP
eukprot:TRINITY_DN674_c0_g1_i2.p1 TRINITY_DN674_c0_g1~~TRINITY_DN674_c0_g1_i2.p1  ORF type:complete len:151 (+),score=10.04 TRINITY_DN674_c0_g1_i2:309-761(+)